MARTLEYCIDNVDAATRRRLRDADGTVREKPCLQRCGDCFSGSILVVDGDLRAAESHADLLDDLEGA